MYCCLLSWTTFEILGWQGQQIPWMDWRPELCNIAPGHTLVIKTVQRKFFDTTYLHRSTWSSFCSYSKEEKIQKWRKYRNLNTIKNNGLHFVHLSVNHKNTCIEVDLSACDSWDSFLIYTVSFSLKKFHFSIIPWKFYFAEKF